jgi:hypothetical protein
MRLVDVREPSGRWWTVKRKLIRLPRFRGFGRPRLDASDGVVASSGSDGAAGLVVGVVVVVTLVLSVAFVWPVIVLLAELLFTAILVGIRFALGKWTVVAESVGERHTWRVRGRARATTFASEVAESLRLGRGIPAGGSFESRVSVETAEAQLSEPAASGHVRVIKP